MEKYAVVGGGIAGLMTAWFLHQENKLDFIYQSPENKSASLIAAGVLNPITGKRFAKTWMADELFPFAEKTYKAIESKLGISFFKPIEVLRIAENMAQINDWQARAQSESFSPYISNKKAPPEFSSLLQPHAGSFFIQGGFKLDVAFLIQALAAFFLLEGKFIQNNWAENEHTTPTILCEGIQVLNNEFVKNLPFVGVKGHYLVCDIPDLNIDFVMHGKATIIPQGNNLYRVGSTYQWEFDHEQVEQSKVDFLEHGLKETIRCEYKLEDVLVGVRPATKDRRPILGSINNNYVLNGLGTKGYSLAPYFAHHLVQHITKNNPILDEVNLNRFL